MNVWSADVCTPTCEGRDKGDYVADPLNCTQYYICLNDCQLIDVPKSCEEGTYFDGSISPPADPCTGSGKCKPLCMNSACVTECVDGINFANDPKNPCQGVIYCASSDKPSISFCPSDKYFSYEKQTCTDNSYDCCDPCIPYCTKPFTQIQNPSNCREYYFCNKDVQIDEDKVHICPEDQMFNSTSGHCGTYDEDFCHENEIDCSSY